MNNCQKVLKYTAIAFVSILNLLVLLMWTGQLSFGHGLGDVVYLGYYTLTAIVGYIIVVVNKNLFVNLLLIVVFIFANFLFIEKATVGRGPEKQWNGHLFVLNSACESDIKNSAPLRSK